MLAVAERERFGGTYPQPMAPRRLANIAQVATIAGVHRNTIYNWIHANKVEWIRTAGGHYRIYVDTIWRVPKD